MCSWCFFLLLVIRSFRFKLDFIIMLNALFPISNRPFNAICKCTLRTRHDARWTWVSRRNQMSNNRIVTCVSVEREQKIKRFSFEISAPNETDKQPIHLCNEPTIERANTRQSQTTHKIHREMLHILQKIFQEATLQIAQEHSLKANESNLSILVVYSWLPKQRSSNRLDFAAK